jgi:hypothetical protein
MEDDMNAYLKEWDEDEIAEWLDSVYEPIEFAGMTIHASDMKDIDPVMFRCVASDMEDVWICDSCDTEHETEEAANECCMFDCFECGDLHETLEDANNCCEEMED